MRTSSTIALGALLISAPAWGMIQPPHASSAIAGIRLVGGDGGGSDTRNTTSVYDGGKAKFNPNRENGGQGYQKRKPAPPVQPTGPAKPQASDQTSR